MRLLPLLPITLLPLTACQTTDTNPGSTSTYFQDLESLDARLENDHISKADYIRELIRLDSGHGDYSSKKWNAVMVRNSSMEGIHDPHRHGLHFHLIEEANENGELTVIEYKELRRLAKEARQARSIRNNKRMMERIQLGYR